MRSQLSAKASVWSTLIFAAVFVYWVNSYWVYWGSWLLPREKKTGVVPSKPSKAAGPPYQSDYTSLAVRWEHEGDLLALSADMKGAFGILDRNVVYLDRKAGYRFFDPYTGKLKPDVPAIAAVRMQNGQYFDPGLAVGFSRQDGRFLVSNHEDHTLRVLEITTGNQLLSVPARCSTVIGLTTGQIGCLSDSSVAVLDPGTGKETWRANLRQPSFDGRIAFSASGVFASGLSPLSINLYDAKVLRLTRTVPETGGGVCRDGPVSLALSADGRYLATYPPWGGRVCVIDTASGSTIGSIEISDHLELVEFSPDGTLLVVAYHTGSSGTGFVSRFSDDVDVYNWKDGKKRAGGYFAPSWAKYRRCFMLPTGEILAQLDDKIVLYAPH
jgi:WD40 repeat protein